MRGLDLNQRPSGHESAVAGSPQEIEYTPGQSFSNMPDEIHLARNEGATEVVLFAVYFVPVSSPPVPLRIDQPSPGAGCPQ